MSKKTIRFGVTDQQGKRAATWRCWTNGAKGKSDIYLACRVLKGSLHVSFHETGQWHIAFDSEKHPKMFEEKAKPISRLPMRWEKPAPISPGLTLAARIHTPWCAVTVPVEHLDPKVFWIQPPVQGKSIEVALFIADPGTMISGWPCRRSMGTSLIGCFDLGNGGQAWLVYHMVPLAEPKPPSGSPTLARGAKVEDLLDNGMRALGCWKAPDGSLVVYEAPVLISRNQTVSG